MEKAELLDNLNSTDDELATKNNELLQIRKTLEEIQNQLNFYVSNFKSAQKKYQELENEKTYLVGIIDLKTNEIERLHHMELEIAEMKAQQLLLNNGLDDDYEDDDYDDRMMKPILRAIMEMSDEISQPEILSD